MARPESEPAFHSTFRVTAVRRRPAGLLTALARGRRYVRGPVTDEEPIQTLWEHRRDFEENLSDELARQALAAELCALEPRVVAAAEEKSGAVQQQKPEDCWTAPPGRPQP